MTKILIVEDDISILQMYQLKLEFAGFSVQTAVNGQLGLEQAERFLPDLLLLDLRMPILSGDAMLEKLRETSWGANIRVIILTNISKAEAPAKLRLLGVDRYIVKAHTTPSEVIAIIREVLA